MADKHLVEKLQGIAGSRADVKQSGENVQLWVKEVSNWAALAEKLAAAFGGSEELRLRLLTAHYLSGGASLLAEFGTFSLRCALPKDVSRIPSLQGIWPVAKWQEQEIYELFGFSIDGVNTLDFFFVRNSRRKFPLMKAEGGHVG